VGQARALDLQWLARAAKAFDKQLEFEAAAQSDSTADGAGKLALARAISSQAQGHDNAMLRIVSDRARRRYSQGHVDARVSQVAQMQARAQAALQMAQEAAEAALAGARDHLWLPPSWLARISAVHDANMALALAMVYELDRLAQGFAALPVDAELDNTAPEPLELAP
jgi:MoxR-like ATPase